jgi:hypothetical protein
MFSTKGEFELPEASIEDITRKRAEYESAAKHGHETRDALIRCVRSANSDMVASISLLANETETCVACGVPVSPHASL